MELLLGGLLKLIGSAGFGTVFGGVIGFFNRKTDLKFKKLEIEENDKQRQHELKQREMDAKIIREEYQGKVQVADVEGSFKALESSYSFAQPEKGSAMGKFSTFVRPFISLCYFLVTSLGAAWVIWYAFEVVGVSFTYEQWYELVMFVIDWVAFMGSACIGWWYGSRASAAPKRQ